MMRHRLIAILLSAGCWLSLTAAAPDGPTISILATADTEGHVDPCQTCPYHVGRGGIARRATAIKAARRDGPALLVDAGDFLCGAGSVGSDGKVIAAAYHAMGYDAVNIAYRDFRFGKAATLAAIKEGALVAVSANLLDSATGEPLFSPYVVKSIAGRKVAILGICEPPPGLAYLPAIREQLAGVTIGDPADAMKRWLPKAHAEADQIVLLYQGSPATLAKLLRAHASEVALAVAGGIRGEQLPPGLTVPVMAVEEHGKEIGVAQLGAERTEAPKLSSIAVTADLADDPQLAKLVFEYAASDAPALAATGRLPTGATTARTFETRSVVSTASATQPATQRALALGQASDPSGPARPAPTEGTQSASQSAKSGGGLMAGLSRLGGKFTSAQPTAPATKPVETASASGSVSNTGNAGLPPVAVTRTERPPIPVAPAVAPTAPPARVPARPDLKPHGLEGVGLSAEQVNGAIDRGCDFLYQTLQQKLEKENRRLFQNDDGSDLLACLALVHAGVLKRHPEFQKQLSEALGRLELRKQELGTYANALLCMLITSYGDAELLPKLRLTAQKLIDEQGKGGTWGYGQTMPTTIFDQPAGPALTVLGGQPTDGPPVLDRLERLTDWSKGMDGDNSVSQFAMLGVWAASHWQIKSPDELWRRAMATYRHRQCADGSWGYDEHTVASGYGSMTCAGVCSLAVARYELGEKQPEVDPDIERGLAWLDQHFTVATNPASGAYQYYYLYSLERVGRLLNTEFIGSHEWFPLGAQYLVRAQRPDGRWVEQNEQSEDPRHATSFALLFLTRATGTLHGDIKRGGFGLLKTSWVMPPDLRLYIILDASGSMLAEMDGKQKFALAQQTVIALINDLPEGTQAALRVYGHRKRAVDEGADDDTELLIPMGPLNKPQFAAAVRALRPRGKTPLARSLSDAKQDLSSSAGTGAPTTFVLLTDGGEDTLPRRDPVKAAGELAGIKGLTLHLIGFDIKQEDWRRQLLSMCEAAHGYYWPAPRGEALVHQLRCLVLGDPDQFDVYDATGKRVDGGRFGESKHLPEGKYRISTTYGERVLDQEVWVNTDSTTALVFDAARLNQPIQPNAATQSAPMANGPSTSGAPPSSDGSPAPRNTSPAPSGSVDPGRTPAAGGASAPDSPPARGAAPQRFCASCGAPLTTGARFCSHCGAKVSQ